LASSGLWPGQKKDPFEQRGFGLAEQDISVSLGGEKMKKFLMVALVLGLVFSMAQVTVADERVTFNGHTRIRAYYIDKDDGVDDDNLEKYTDFRFRLGTVINVAEGITANLRLDYNDNSKWGLDTGNEGRTEGDKEMTVERAFIRIEKDMFIFQGGQIFQGFGHFTAYTPQGVGFATRLKLPVQLDINYFKISEGNTIEDEDDADKDHNMYSLQATYKADTFNIGGYYATEIDDSATDAVDDGDFENKNVIGLWGDAKLGPVAIKAALDMFSGTRDEAVDYMGTQMWLNGGMEIVENFTLGADIWYAMAADDDGSEEQIIRIADTLADAPCDKHMAAQFLGKFSDVLNVLDNGFPTPYEMDPNAGVMAFDVYGLFDATEDLSFGASVGYWLPQDDDVGINNWENSLVFQGSVLWSFAPKCDLFGAFYHRTDNVEDEDVDAELGMAAALKISW
jgi:opacity protein-like surface antigen